MISTYSEGNRILSVHICRESEENFDARTGTMSRMQSRADALSEPGTPSEVAQQPMKSVQGRDEPSTPSEAAQPPVKSIQDPEKDDKDLESAAALSRGKGKCWLIS